MSDPPTAESPAARAAPTAPSDGALVSASASSVAAETPKKCLADALEGPKPKRSSRHLHRRDTEEQVDRIISIRFADFPSAAIDAKRIEGKTLREALLHERRSKKATNGRIPVATVEKFRAAYAADDAPSRILKPPGKKSESCSMDLVRALAHAHHSNPAKRSKQQLYAFFATTTSLNETETIGLLKSVASVAPSSSLGARRHLMEVMRFLAQCDLDLKFPLAVAVLRPRFDECMSLMWQGAKKGGEKLTCWWSAFRGPARLCINCKLVDKVLEEQGSWSNARSEVESITTASSLGRALFWKAHGALLVEGFSKEIDSTVAFLRSLTPVHRGHDPGAEGQVASLQHRDPGQVGPGVHPPAGGGHLPQLPLEPRGGGLEGEVDFKFSSLFKELSTGFAAGIPPFGPESFLLPVNRDERTKVPAELLTKFVNCRSSANAFIESLQLSTGKEIYEALKPKVMTFTSLDRTFPIEFAWLQSMMQEGGSTVLESKLLSCMPSKDQHPSLDSVLASLDLLMKGDLYKFVASSAQGSCNAAYECLLDLKRGCFNPKSLKLSAGFLMSFVERVQWFCSFKVAASGDFIYGQDVAEAHFAKWFEEPSTSPSFLQELETISKFKYLLNQTQQDKVQAAIANILKLSSSSSSASAVAIEAGAAPAKKRKKGASAAKGGKDPEQGGMS